MNGEPLGGLSKFGRTVSGRDNLGNDGSDAFSRWNWGGVLDGLHGHRVRHFGARSHRKRRCVSR